MIEKWRNIAKRIPFVADAYRRWRDTRWRSVDPQPTPHGFLLTGHADMVLGRFEREETEVIKRLLPHFDRFVNVGANIGYYVCHAIVASKPVIAVEPLRQNLEYLLVNVKANRRDVPVEIYPVALADVPDVLSLYGSGTAASLIPGWAHSSAISAQLTPVLTLDTILGGRFDKEKLLILIDVEGVEYKVLSGAKKVLSRSPKPIFMVEVSLGEHSGGSNPFLLKTFEIFWSLGYACSTAKTTPVAVSRQEILAIASGGSNSLSTQNFLFHDPQLNLEAMFKTCDTVAT